LGTLKKALVLRVNGDNVAYLLNPGDLKHPGDLQRELSFRALADPNISWQVDEVQTLAWRLETGQEAVIQIGDTGKPIIVSVDGMTDSDCAKARPSYGTLVTTPRSRPDYPDEPWNIGVGGGLTARTIELWTKIGRGSQIMVPGPFKVGKTESVQAMVRGIFTDAKNRGRKFVAVMLQVSERGPDVTQMEAILAEFPELKVFHFVATTGETSEIAAVNICEMAANVVRRQVEASLALGQEVDILYCVDSVSGLGLAYNPLSPAGSPLTSGGISAFAMKKVQEHVALAGKGTGMGNGYAITGIFTALVDEKNTSSVSLFVSAGGPQSSVIIWHADIRGMRYPKISLAKSSTRKWQLLLGDGPEGDFYREYHERLMVMDDDIALETLQNDALFAGSFEELMANVRRRWAENDRGRERGRARDDAQAIVNVGHNVGRIKAKSPEQAATSLNVMLKNVWGDLSEALAALLQYCSAADRANVLAILEKSGLTVAKTGTLLERLLADAEELRASGDSLPDAARQVIAKLGLSLDQLIAAKKDDPEEVMMGVAKRLAAEANQNGQSFGRKTARDLVINGWEPDEVYTRLKAGASPKQLLREKRK